MKDISKRVAVVTGGTRGIGAAISLMLAERGHTVVAVYRSNTSRAAEFRNKLQALSTESCVVRGDVGKREEATRIVEEAVHSYGSIEILVNNAAMFDFRTLEQMDEEYINEIVDTNFKSQLFMMQEVIPHMKKSNFGRIVNASSISATTADVGLIGYGSTKAAVEMTTRIAAAELAPYNITVNGYAPGIIHTDLTDEMIRERGEIQKKQIPLQRFGTCEEVAELVLFLASEASSYITGETIAIDGGMLKVQNPSRAYETKN